VKVEQYLERHKFTSPGECIYCGARGDEVELTDEHIIPFSLGGNAEILKASCKSCATITSELELHLGRQVLWDHRVHAKLPTRRPEGRPDTLPTRVSIAFGAEHMAAMDLNAPSGIGDYLTRYGGIFSEVARSRGIEPALNNQTIGRLSFAVGMIYGGQDKAVRAARRDRAIAEVRRLKAKLNA
jgi:hypothetical protein